MTGFDTYAHIGTSMYVPGFGLTSPKGFREEIHIFIVIPTGFILFYSRGTDSCSHSFPLTRQAK